MLFKSNKTKNFGEHFVKIIGIEFKQIQELLSSSHRILKTQLSKTDPETESEKYYVLDYGGL